jgi:hypothetical protein
MTRIELVYQRESVIKAWSYVSADLGTEVNEALTQSRYLIVVCSRNSAKSVWVNEKIKFFKKLGRENRVLALIVDGEPNASEHKPGFTADDECFPEALRYRVGSDGRVLPLRTEPVAGDAREGKDGSGRAHTGLPAIAVVDKNSDLRRCLYVELRTHLRSKKLNRPCIP